MPICSLQYKVPHLVGQSDRAPVFGLEHVVWTTRDFARERANNNLEVQERLCESDASEPSSFVVFDASDWV